MVVCTCVCSDDSCVFHLVFGDNVLHNQSVDVDFPLGTVFKILLHNNTLFSVLCLLLQQTCLLTGGGGNCRGDKAFSNAAQVPEF